MLAAFITNLYVRAIPVKISCGVAKHISASTNMMLYLVSHLPSKHSTAQFYVSTAETLCYSGCQVVSTKILVIVHKVCGRKFGKGMAARQGTALTLNAFFFSGEGGDIQQHSFFAYLLVRRLHCYEAGLKRNQCME